MPVLVVQVWKVRMLVREACMLVTVRVGLADWVLGSVPVFVMLVVNVRVLVLHGFMHMLMFVPLGQVQVNANRHEHSGKDEFRRNRITKQHDANNRADERRC